MSAAGPSAPPGPAPDDAKLLERLRAGEGAAYEELVRANASRLLAVTRRMLGSEEDARDAVQEAFLSAFRALPRFQGDARLSTWLHRIAVNAALMRLRTRRRKPEVAIDDLMPRFLEDGHHAEPPQPWPGADELIGREETRRAVRDAIDRLPETHRTVLLLRDIEGIDTAEVAEMLGISPGAVKTRLHRARAALRELVDPLLRDAEAAGPGAADGSSGREGGL